jgi:hypothetical protein
MKQRNHLRRVRCLVLLEDDSIAGEPPVENSGIPQQCFIKRHRLPKVHRRYAKSRIPHIRDFNRYPT